MTATIDGKVSLSGIGMTEIGQFPERTPLDLAVEAFKLAIDDAGIEKDDVDGLLVLSFGSDYDRVLEALGLDVRYAYQGWTHGRFISTMLQHAVMAVATGLARCVAILHGRTGSRRAYGTDHDLEMWRQGLGPHGESPAYGALAPAFGAAIAANRYFDLYGGSSERLAPVAVSLRNNASLNPRAYRRDPITVEDHQSSPWIIEPLRRLDCCQMNDGGTCILVMDAAMAKDCRHSPVYVMGMQGVHAGPEYHNFAQPGLGVAQQSVHTYEPEPHPVYEMAGVSKDDIDALTVYDAFSPMVLFALERFGFCGPGEAMDFVEDGRIEIGGALPVNTSGGLLSEGHLIGWNLYIEMVRQLRHQCGDRQIEDAGILQWGSFLGDSVILRR